LKADGQADFVVAISHNSISANEKILSQAPSVDLVISGHKHRKLTRPIFVTRNDADPGWVVETGCWGQYLGRVDLKVTDGKVELADYKLIQMDSSVPEDPKVLETINRIERKVEEARGPIFQDVIGHSEMEFSRTGLNNPMGNIVMDAYLRTIQADFALDSIQFINGKLYPGPIRSVDVFNAVPAVFNPATGKSWTVKTLPISGRTLKWFLYLFYSTSRIASLDLLTTSGIRFDYDTIIYQNMLFNNFGPQPLLAGTMAIPPVKNIIIRGEPIEMDRMYQMVTGQGMIEAIEFVNKNIYEAIPLDSMVDHGIESWRVLAEYIQTISPLNRQKFSPENRIRILVGDLGVYPEDIEWTPYEGNSTTRNFGRLKVRIKNYGASDTFDPTFFSGSQLHVFQDQNGRNTAIDPEYVEIGSPQSLGSIKTGESTEVQMDLDFKPIPGSNYILVRIDGDRSDSNISNNEAVFWLE
jgi:hypothetical protein